MCIRDRLLLERLEQQAKFTETVIETLLDGVAVCHEVTEYPHVRFTVWNRAMRDLTGYTLEEINCLGWYQTVYIQPEVQERARLRMNRMRQGEQLVREEWVLSLIHICQFHHTNFWRNRSRSFDRS